MFLTAFHVVSVAKCAKRGNLKMKMMIVKIESCSNCPQSGPYPNIEKDGWDVLADDWGIIRRKK